MTARMILPNRVVWALAVAPAIMMMLLARPAANPARTRQRCRQSIAVEPFWTGPPPKGRSSRTLTGPISAKTDGGDSIPIERIARSSSLIGRRRRPPDYSNRPLFLYSAAMEACIGRIAEAKPKFTR